MHLIKLQGCTAFNIFHPCNEKPTWQKSKGKDQLTGLQDWSVFNTNCSFQSPWSQFLCNHSNRMDFIFTDNSAKCQKQSHSHIIKLSLEGFYALVGPQLQIEEQLPFHIAKLHKDFNLSLFCTAKICLLYASMEICKSIFVTKN